jgi:transposase
MEQITTIGLDLAKRVFQAHGVDASGRAVTKARLMRDQVEPFFAKTPPCLVAMEACSGAHHWARRIAKLGHEVRLVPASRVKPFVGRQKNDAADAAAIAAAARHPDTRFAAVKTEGQQALLLDHRTRDLLIRQRTMLINALRGHLAEFGIVAAAGLGGMRAILARVESGEALAGIPHAAHPALRTLASGVRGLDYEVKAIEARLKAARADEPAVKRLMSIPGVGIITATALAATVPDAKLFRSGRDLAAWLGLVPRQFSSGGKTRLGGVSKMGDRYLRRLLFQGAVASIHWSRRKPGFAGSWIGHLVARKPMRLAAMAYANKMARIAWALMTRGEDYRDPQAA